MTSPKSLQNNFGYAYRTGLRSCSWIAVLNAIILFLNFGLNTIMTFASTTRIDRENGEVKHINYKEIYSFLFSDGMEYNRYLVIAVLLGVGILMGIAAFRFITGKKTVNVYYSLGIKRTRLFSAKYLAGLTLIGLSIAVPMLVALIANIVVLGVNRYMMYAFFYLVFGMFSVAAFSFTLTAAVFATVGTMVEGAVFSGILLLFPEMLFYCLQVFIQKLVFGTPLGQNFTQQTTYYGGFSGTMGANGTEMLSKTYAQFNPLRYFSKGLYTYSNAAPAGKLTDYNDSSTLLSWHTPDFLTVLIWLFATVAVFALGVYLFERRKAEIGGFIGKNKVLNFVTSFLIGISGFAFLFKILQSAGKSMALSMVLGAVTFLVLYALFNLIMLRNLREFVKDLRGLPIQAALLALILVFFATGYFGTANKMPETAEIATARISTPYWNFRSEMAGQDYAMYYYGVFGSGSESRLLGEYKNESDIKAVQNIHRMLLDAGRVQPTAMNQNFDGTYAYTVKIEYTLKNGEQVRRCYNGVSAEIMNALQQLDKTDCQKALLDKIFKDELKKPETKDDEFFYHTNSPQLATYRYISAIRESEDIRLYNKTLSTETHMDLTAEQRQTLRDCLYKDLLAQEPEDLYNPKNSLGVLSFTLLPLEIDDSFSETIITEAVTGAVDSEVVYDEYGNVISGEESFTGKDMKDYFPDFLLTPDMVNTLAFLKSVGYYDVLVNEKPIKAAYGIVVNDMFSESYYDDFANAGDPFPCEFLARSGDNNMLEEYRWRYKNLEKITDEKLIADMHKNAATRGEILPTDYIVVFEYADGIYATTLVHSADMPEGAKTAIAKNTKNQW